MPAAQLTLLGDLKMTLLDALKRGLSIDSNWAIYAESPFTAESESRVGQTQFENGGKLDDKEFVVNGEQLENYIEEFRQNIEDLLEDLCADQSDFHILLEEWIEDDLIMRLDLERCARVDFNEKSFSGRQQSL